MTLLAYALYFAALIGLAWARALWMARVYVGRLPALNILLVGLTLIFLFVVVTLPAFAAYSGTASPTTIGGFFPPS